MSTCIEDYLTTSTLSVAIPSFSERYIDKNTVTFYIIEIYNNYSKQKWVLEKRYSEFEALGKNLAKVIPNVPEMPGKTFFKVTSYEGLMKRKSQLEQFLRECVQRKEIISNENFKDFLELEKHSPELSFNSPIKMFEFTDVPLGVRDFIYIKSENIIFIACCDMNIASRLDAYITNVNLPWEKKTDAHISVGGVLSYKVTYDPNSGYQFDKVWGKSFPVQTGVISWEGESMTLAVGLDNGTIYLVKVIPNSNFLQYEELFQLKPHKDRVMGIAFDSKSGYIYSCSTDMKFLMTDINYKDSCTEITESSHGYTNLVFDKKNERIFLTNEAGVFSVFTTTSFPPSLVNSIQTSAKASIRGLHIDYKKFYIFTGSTNGQICVLELGIPKKERLIKEISTFGGNMNMNIRVVRYNSNLNELITGDQDGKITVWSLKTGQPVFAYEAHTSAITQIFYDEETRILMSGAKDKYIKIWKLPEKWRNEEITQFEENETKNMSDTIAMLKLQRTLTKSEDDDDDSDLDDLNGWDFR